MRLGGGDDRLSCVYADLGGGLGVSLPAGGMERMGLMVAEMAMEMAMEREREPAESRRGRGVGGLSRRC